MIESLSISKTIRLTLSLGLGLFLSGCSGRSGADLQQQGTRQLQNGNHRAAARNLRRASSRIGNSASLYYNLGTAYYHLGKLDGAAEAFQSALEIDPDDAKACEFLGCVYLERQDWPAARNFLQQALALASPDDMPRLLNSLFLAEKGEDRTDLGLLRLLRARRLNWRHAPTLYNLASLYRDAYQMYEESLDLFEMYLRLAPDADPHRDKARESIKRLKTAIPDAGEARRNLSDNRRTPAAAMSAFRAGEAHRQAQRWDRAATEYAAALERYPRFYEAAFNRGYVLSADGKWREAIKAYQRAGEIEPQRVDPLYMQAREAYTGQDYDEAARLLAWHAIPRWPNHAPNFELMAYVCHALGKYDDARAYGEHYVVLSPASAERQRFSEWLNALPR